MAASVILTWEHPTELWMETLRTVDIHTYIGTYRHHHHPFVLARDVPWGCFEDVENGIDRVHYHIRYLDGNGRAVAQVFNDDIRRYENPGNLCRVQFYYTTDDGAPWANRTIEFTSLHGSEGSFYRKIVTNRKGKALIFLKPGAQLRLVLAGAPTAFDLAVPDMRDADQDSLLSCSSPCPIDPRSSIGGNLYQ